MSQIRTIFFTLISSILFALSGPGFISPFLSIVFLLPACFAYIYLEPKKAFLFGLFQWSVAYGISNYWFLNTFISIYKINILLSIFYFVIAAILFYGLYNALFTLFLSVMIRKIVSEKFPDLSLSRKVFTIFSTLLGGSLLWSLIEFIRGLVFPAFNITTLSSYFYIYPSVLQPVKFIGEHLMSGLIIGIGITLFFIMMMVLNKKMRISGNIKIIAAAASIVFIGAGIIGYISFSDNRPITQLNIREKYIMLIQANVPSEKKWKKRYYEEIMNRYFSFIDRFKSDSTKIVIWPETAINFYPQINSSLRDKLISQSEKENITIITGGPEFVREGNQYTFYNSIFAIANGEIVSVYKKEELVPFAEYCPIPFLYPLFRRIIGETQFSSYTNNETVIIDGIPVSFAICFESTFPGLISSRADESDVLIILSDDIWLGDTSGPRQHLATMVIRAIENRQWIVSCNNSGPSAIISPEGNIVGQRNFGNSGVLFLND